MKASLLLLDRGPLRALVGNNAPATGTARLVQDAWLRDRCVFSPISLIADDASPPSALHPPSPPDALRLALLGAGLRDVDLSWETLRESLKFTQFRPFSYEWLLLGVASHLDATLVTDAPTLLQPLTPEIPRLAWTAERHAWPA